MPEGAKSFTKTEIRAGFFVIVSGIIAIGFLLVMTTLLNVADEKTFKTYFENTVGLDKGAEVRFGGVRVGTVSRIEPVLDAGDTTAEGEPGVESVEGEAGPTRLILVEMKVKDDTPVNEASTASISQVTLTAQKHVAISTGTVDAEELKEGDTIPTGGGDLFTQLAEVVGDVRALIGTKDAAGRPLPDSEFESVGGFLQTLNDTVVDVRALIGASEPDPATAAQYEDITTVVEILDNVDAAITGGNELVSDVREIVTENRDTIKEIMDKVPEIEDTAKKLLADLDAVIVDNRGKIDSAMASLESLLKTAAETADKLAAELDTLTDTLQATMTNVERMTGDAQVLLENNAPTIEDIILDVKDITRNLKEFSRTLADEPQAVIRGKNVSGRK